MRATSTVGLLSAFICLPAIAFQDLPEKCEVTDPEFHDGIGMIVYQHLRVSDRQPQAVVEFVDPSNFGALLPSTEGTLASDLATFQISQAGPKFSHGKNAQGQLEDYIVYTRAVGSDFAVAIRKYNAVGNCASRSDALACFTSSGNNGQIPQSAPPSGIERQTAYTTEEETLEYRAQAIYNYNDGTHQSLTWAPVEDFLTGHSGGSETFFQNDTVDYIWGRLQEKKTNSGNGKKLVAVTVFRPSGPPVIVQQVHLVDASNGATEKVTPDTAGLKFNPYLFQHAGLEALGQASNMVVYRRQTSLAYTTLEIYREQTLGLGNWALFASLTAASIGEDDTKRPYLLSPEAFKVSTPTGVRTYLIFYSANQQFVQDQATNRIWVARIDADGTITAKMESIDDDSIRIEPEVYFPTSTSVPIIFYNQYANDETNCPKKTCPQGAPFCTENFNLRRVVLTLQDLP